jgi:hypothetical protein
MQFSSKGFRTAGRDTRRFLPIDFAHEIGDLVFPEMAVDENESFFGEVEIFGVGRVQTEPGGERILKKPPTCCFQEKSRITAVMGKSEPGWPNKNRFSTSNFLVDRRKIVV